MLQFPDKLYDVVLSDCPWFYAQRFGEGTKFGKGARQYDVMRTKDICALNIQRLCKPNCILFMWATWPCMQDAFDVISAWGFKYKTCGFVWVKENINQTNNKYFRGPGYYTGGNSEACLIATKGKVLKPHARLTSQVICQPKMRHSQKPDAVHERIDKMYPEVYNKCELFARREYPGWDCYGLDLGYDLRNL